MPLRHISSFLALAAALPAAALAQSANDFSLEPVPAPSASPQAQGPADTQNGVAIRPRVVNTPSPSPTAAASRTPAPTPTPQPSAEQVLNRAAPRPTPLPSVTPRPVATVPAQPGAQDTPESQPEPGTTGEISPPAALPTVSASGSPLSLPSNSAAPDEAGDDVPWPLLGALAAALAALAAGFAVWRRRREAIVPQIERPEVRAPVPAQPAAIADALQLRVEYEKLIRSAAYATLKYRMTLVNRTDAPLADVAVGIDLVSAHSGAPMDQQIATTATQLENRHTIARIAPRQNVTLQGQVQLPLAQAHVIRQGSTPLLVPLMRVRVDGPGEGALLKTFVVGQGDAGGGRVQPFRLDEGPRSYEPIGMRELA